MNQISNKNLIIFFKKNQIRMVLIYPLSEQSTQNHINIL